MGLMALNCPNCGGAVEPYGAEYHYKCGKCGFLSRIVPPTTNKVEESVPFLHLPSDPTLDKDVVITLFKNWLFGCKDIPADIQNNLEINSCQLVYVPFIYYYRENNGGWMYYLHEKTGGVDNIINREFPSACYHIPSPIISRKMLGGPERNDIPHIPYDIDEYEEKFKNIEGAIKGYIPYYILFYTYKDKKFAYVLKALKEDHFATGTYPKEEQVSQKPEQESIPAQVLKTKRDYSWVIYCFIFLSFIKFIYSLISH
jgi:hypothetical protein